MGEFGALAMSENATLLTALQYADSFFPSGGSAFSWGLEALCADRQITSADAVRRFLEEASVRVVQTQVAEPRQVSALSERNP